VKVAKTPTVRRLALQRLRVANWTDEQRLPAAAYARTYYARHKNENADERRRKDREKRAGWSEEKLEAARLYQAAYRAKKRQEKVINNVTRRFALGHRKKRKPIGVFSIGCFAFRR